MNQHTHHTHNHTHHSHAHHAHTHTHHTSHGNIGVAFMLNTTFAIIELVGGFFTNSVAIMSDALHDFGDSLSLGTAWFFQRKSDRARTASFTYGYKRFSLIGAFINAIVLTVGSVFVIKESVGRLFEPQQPDPKGMILLAVLGVVVNGAAMLRLRKGSSINERVVSLHFLEDVLGWVAVLIGAIVMYFYEVPILDPILSLAIAVFVLLNVYRNIRPVFQIILQGIPEGITEESVRDVVRKDSRISEIHDYHIWTLDGEQHILSMHVVVNSNLDIKQAEKLKEDIKVRLKAELAVYHATIEVEFEPELCRQRERC